MRKAYSNQMRLDSVPVENVRLNIKCRDSIIPVLRALQHLYCDRPLTDDILRLIGNDINDNTRTDTGREGMDYWHICVLLAVRLGCDYTYDQLLDLAENHRSLRAIMGTTHETNRLSGNDSSQDVKAPVCHHFTGRKCRSACSLRIDGTLHRD